jgi:hypothetical protein
MGENRNVALFFRKRLKSKKKRLNTCRNFITKDVSQEIAYTT